MNRSFWKSRRARGAVAWALVLPLAIGLALPAQAVAEDVPPEVNAPETEASTDIFSDTAPEPDVPENERSETLGPQWAQQEDRTWTTVGDSSGFHIFAAEIDSGYSWRQVATLGMDMFETDRWIGNACLTAGGEWLAVTFAPRAFTNDEILFSRGAFAAFVSLDTGEVVQLDGGYSLAYFNPGCGASGLAAFAQYADDSATKISTFDPADPTSERIVVEVPDQLTSVVPHNDGVYGALGGSVVSVDAQSNVRSLADADGLAFDLAATAEGGIAYLEHDGELARAMLLSDVEGSNASTPVELASGDLDSLGITSDASGGVYITGEPSDVTAALPAGVEHVEGAAVRSTASSSGEVLLAATGSLTDQAGAAQPDEPSSITVAISGTVTATEEDVTFSVAADSDSRTAEAFTIADTQAKTLMSESATSPVSDGALCAVPRNDPSIQAMQPRPAEVEWAVNQGVRSTLHSSFPLPSLSGGGHVPAQIMLGILAQESNFWQASKFVVPGVSGNPLVGNFFGVDRDNSAPDAWWQIDYGASDCGYGIAQVTDGMRNGGMPYSQQLAIAVDYKANIARGLQILIEKWNQTRDAGLIINDGDPKYMENWFYALWAYNTGFYTHAGSGNPWGVGWLNNPINQLYPANRTPFLDGRPEDAAHPQEWPYSEKVLGFAAHSVQLLDSVQQALLGDSFKYAPAYTPAWWAGSDGAGGVINRENVKPPIDLFCDASNECNPSNTAAPCTRSDYKCWFHKPVIWKADCASQCGYEYLTHSLGASKPAGANSFPANCTRTGLPSNALIVDNLPNGTQPVRGGCTPVTTTGNFQFNFPVNSAGVAPAKVDVHQLGSGFNSQFYFSHTRVPGTNAAFNGALDFSGTWNLGQTLDGWAQVYVHMPSHGAWLQQAAYSIDTGSNLVVRSINQRNYENQWVSLGTLQFSGTPTITLANNTAKYSDAELADQLSGADDIAWDAVAFVPLAQKPADFVVALGDSYSSGEGTSPADGSGFMRGSDHHGLSVGNESDPNRNACHRSTNAWPYGINIPSGSSSGNIRTLALANDPRLDFQMLACAGAVTNNILDEGTGGSSQQFGELTQLDRGFLDTNTTLVTMTIGGNDVGFGPIVRTCATAFIANCEDAQAPDDEFAGTLGEMVDSRLSNLSSKVTTALQRVHNDAPHARIILLGYPTLFETNAQCLNIDNQSMPWLNSVADRLNSTLTQAAFDAGPYVTYQSPQYLFTGSNVCTPDSALNGLIFTLTPGDKPDFEWPVPGPNLGLGVSAQAVHPNAKGSELYATVANFTMRMNRVDLASSLVGGAATTYYSTFRLHNGGPVSMNVSNFGACGNEIRFGLRKNDANSSGVFGEQHTDTLSWTSAHSMQTFVSTDGPGRNFLSSGWYALNGRLTAGCPGGNTQLWQAQLYW